MAKQIKSLGVRSLTTASVKKQQRKALIEKLADKIATGRRKFVTVDRELLAEVGKAFTKKYKGTFTWFGLGSALCIRKSTKPLELK